MLSISELNRGNSPDTIVYNIFSKNWKKVYEIELNKAEFQKLKAKKSKITHVSWMQVLAQSCPVAKTGTYATEVENLKDLK